MAYSSGPRPSIITVARYFLHWWVYSLRKRAQETYALQAITFIIQESRQSKPQIMAQFVQDSILSFEDDFPRHLLIKVCHRLRHETVVELEANSVIGLLCVLIMAGREAFSVIDSTLADGTSIIPSIMISFRRQQCSSSVEYKDDFMKMAISVLT